MSFGYDITATRRDGVKVTLFDRKVNPITTYPRYDSCAGFRVKASSSCVFVMWEAVEETVQLSTMQNFTKSVRSPSDWHDCEDLHGSYPAEVMGGEACTMWAGIKSAVATIYAPGIGAVTHSFDFWNGGSNVPVPLESIPTSLAIKTCSNEDAMI